MKIIKQPTNEFGFPFIAYIPDHISDHPALLLQLHGAGERGDKPEELDLVLFHGYSKVVTDENLKDCILVMPQCPKNSFWVAKVESIRKFIDHIVAAYSVDPGRIYMCGLSMGGYGTWYTAMAYPDLFAAIAPCCGGGMAWNAGVLTMPVWAFHGADDTVVSPYQTREMANALQGQNPHFRCTFYDGVGHDSWNKAFSEDLLRWFFSHRK
jgi:predicted peptidase